LRSLSNQGSAGVLAALLGPSKILPNQLGGLKAQDYDYFHEFIVQEEVSRCFFGASAFEKSLMGGMVIGAPPVMHFGLPELQKRLLPAILSGENKIVLAISEPFAGSDVGKREREREMGSQFVASIKTTAKLSADGKHYMVNGVKKWITGGPYADSFATAVRTGNTGTAADISMLLIERKHGVETNRIQTSAGQDTAYVTFENCKVPVENLLGKEGMGFQVVKRLFC
jgi:alkylation response protein AidB-like acyl-CoA dehydrogenase